jgi:hypothetical protein
LSNYGNEIDSITVNLILIVMHTDAAYDGPKGFPHGFHCYEEKFIPLTNPLMVVGHYHIFCC